MSPALASISSITFSSDTIAKIWSSTTPAVLRKANARSDDWSGKKPNTTTRLATVSSLACSAEATSTAGGPVFFFSHAMMSSACRPPVQI